MVIILTEEDAIKESINRPNHRVEIFSKTAQQDILLRIIIINMENLFTKNKTLQIIHFQNDEKI